MKVLQNGCPKSGNYWLYNLLSEILDAGGVERRSVIQEHPIYPLARTWPLSYPEQAGLDVLDIESGKCFLRISSYYREPINDLDQYIENNRLVWTHSRHGPKSESVYDKFNKVVYIIRDPRDVAISMAHFAFTPYRLKTNNNPFVNADDYLRLNLMKHVTGWCQHVGSHLLAPSRENMHMLFYERLRSDFDGELIRLLSFLEIDLDEHERAAIGNKVSVSSMRKKSKGHVREGTSGGWRETLSASQVRQVNLVASPILKALGYPLRASEDRLPELVASKVQRKKIRWAMRRSMLARAYWMFAANRKYLERPDGAAFEAG